MTNSEARKRAHEVAEAAEVASGAPNSPETGNRTSGPENGAVDVAAIRARVEAATPGPWTWEPVGEMDNGWCLGVVWDADDQPLTGRILPGSGEVIDSVCENVGASHFHDAEFIAYARTDVPALLAELDRLTTALAAERARVAAGLALAEAWAREAAAGRTGNGHALLVQTYDGHARELRAALTTAAAPTTESKEDDHA